MKLQHRASLVVPCLSLVLCLGACATQPAQRQAPPAPAPVAPPPPAASPDDDDVRDGMKLEGQMGQIDEGVVEEQFRGRRGDINRCYQDVLQRLWYLSGRLQLKLRIARDGAVRAASVVETSLGNYDIERCVVQIAKQLSFPAPKGGEAEFTYPMEFPARASVGSWPERRVALQLGKARGQLDGCQGQARPRLKAGPPSLRMTLYIGPGGKVTSAGLSADEPIDERMGACLVSRVQGLRFEDPLGKMVKATYAFN